MGCNLSSELCAHVCRLRLRADSAEVEPVSIPTRANRWVITQLTVCVPCAGEMKKLEM